MERNNHANQPRSPETINPTVERKEYELPHNESLANERESNELNLDKSRDEVEALAKTTQEHRQTSPENQAQQISINKSDKEHTYSVTLSHTQNRLKGISKTFSRFIHQPAVENTSEAIGNTLARPSGLLGAGTFAFGGLLIMTYFARRNGFALSGFEFTLFIIIGWILGLISEGLLRFYKNKH